MKNLYTGDYRTANSIDPPTSPMGIAAGMGGAQVIVLLLTHHHLGPTDRAPPSLIPDPIIASSSSKINHGAPAKELICLCNAKH